MSLYWYNLNNKWNRKIEIIQKLFKIKCVKIFEISDTKYFSGVKYYNKNRT